uniref:Uncharacterized protein n=1 Tax=Anguilla anguilla TaxID=7936 RepID=A0A0E9RMR4_ANGAN
MWSSAAAAHQLQGLTCCAFRDALLLITAVSNCYMSLLWPSCWHEQILPLPLNNKAFLPTELPLTGFLFILFNKTCSPCLRALNIEFRPRFTVVELWPLSVCNLFI